MDPNRRYPVVTSCFDWKLLYIHLHLAIHLYPLVRLQLLRNSVDLGFQVLADAGCRFFRTGLLTTRPIKKQVTFGPTEKIDLAVEPNDVFEKADLNGRRWDKDVACTWKEFCARYMGRLPLIDLADIWYSCEVVKDGEYSDFVTCDQSNSSNLFTTKTEVLAMTQYGDDGDAENTQDDSIDYCHTKIIRDDLAYKICLALDIPPNIALCTCSKILHDCDIDALTTLLEESPKSHLSIYSDAFNEDDGRHGEHSDDDEDCEVARSADENSVDSENDDMN